MTPQLYSCVTGDTLATVAQRFYGSSSDEHQARIAAASAVLPGEVLQPGQLLTIP